MTFKKRKIRSSLRKKGFEEDKDGKHISLTYITLDGNESPIKTHVSHGSKSRDLGDSLISEMAKQVKLSTEDFKQLVLCKMGQADYEEIIKKHI